MDLTKMTMEQLFECGLITQEEYDRGFVTYNEVIANLSERYGTMYEQLGLELPSKSIFGNDVGFARLVERESIIDYQNRQISARNRAIKIQDSYYDISDENYDSNKEPVVI